MSVCRSFGTVYHRYRERICLWAEGRSLRVPRRQDEVDHCVRQHLLWPLDQWLPVRLRFELWHPKKSKKGSFRGWFNVLEILLTWLEPFGIRCRILFSTKGVHFESTLLRDHEKLALFFHNNHVIFLTVKDLKNPIIRENKRHFLFQIFTNLRFCFLFVLAFVHMRKRAMERSSIW